jgi:alkanesulfonate monooxygenase SsuD/methylene tetrahydromethanopterin reductase-like flavin-dependent oxidoreductase (luciferase family)
MTMQGNSDAATCPPAPRRSRPNSLSDAAGGEREGLRLAGRTAAGVILRAGRRAGARATRRLRPRRSAATSPHPGGDR